MELGLDMIAVTDHHSVENVEAVQQAARPRGIRVLPGMEVQTREEVHLLCLFDDLNRALGCQAWVWEHLPPLMNREAFFGPQYVVDETGRHLRTNERLLQTSLDLGFETVLEFVQNHGGLAVPAHVDRPRNSLYANLGMVPEEVRLEGAEISRKITPDEARRRFPSLQGLGLVQSGDAHRLSEMINTTQLFVKRRNLDELRLALQGRQGRGILLSGMSSTG